MFALRQILNGLHNRTPTSLFYCLSGTCTQISSTLSPNRITLVALSICLGFGCGLNSQPKGPNDTSFVGLSPLSMQQVEDNVQHDTLLVQVTFDLKDGSYLMAASNREERFEGLRLYRYRALPDSSAEVLATSAPAYDSWTMLPTFFAADSNSTDDLWLLVNFGERESWGQKLMRLTGEGFKDCGFLDAALPVRVTDEEGARTKRGNIAPFARLEFVGDSTWIRFACDSVHLYDDQRGGLDRNVPASTVRFLHAPDEGLSLWLNDEKRMVKMPS